MHSVPGQIQHKDVKEAYIAAVHANPQQIDADVQVKHSNHILITTATDGTYC